MQLFVLVFVLGEKWVNSDLVDFKRTSSSSSSYGPISGSWRCWEARKLKMSKVDFLWEGRAEWHTGQPHYWHSHPHARARARAHAQKNHAPVSVKINWLSSFAPVWEFVSYCVSLCSTGRETCCIMVWWRFYGSFSHPGLLSHHERERNSSKIVIQVLHTRYNFVPPQRVRVCVLNIPACLFQPQQLFFSCRNKSTLARGQAFSPLSYAHTHSL